MTDAGDFTAPEDAPTMRVFQLDGAGSGAMSTCVNLFRGAVSLPLPLISLRGRSGVDVNVTISYDGGTFGTFATAWNASSPTSVLGLGWSMPQDMIARSSADPAAPDECTYYLVRSGTADELVCTGKDSAGRWSYITTNYEFWQITYDPETEVWQVVTEDGTASSYGGLPTGDQPDAVVWGVAWGNWAGASCGSLGTQQRFARAWQLNSQTSPLGDTITYAYDSVEEEVGAGGLTYTKASYLASITDVFGRVVKFSYAEKLYGEAGPGGTLVYEYLDPHKNPSQTYPDDSPDAYQDCYETRYLDTITVLDGNNVLSLLRFGYDLQAFTDTKVTPDYRWKRCLTSIRQYNSHGESMPGVRMEYVDATGTPPGALSTLTHPYGGTAQFHYTEQQLPTARDLTISSPSAGSFTPRVWHGPDYSVVAWYGTTDDAPLTVTVYSWIGRWTQQLLIGQSVQLELSTLNVVAAEDYLAVCYRIAGGQDSLQVFRRDLTSAGAWQESWSGAFELSGANPPATILSAGDDFVVVANTGYQNQAVQAIGWDYRSRSWQPIPTPTVPTGTSDVLAIAGRSGFYATCAYNNSAQTAAFTIVSRGQSGSWSVAGTWSDSFPLLTADPVLGLTLGPTHLVVTAVTGQDADTLTSQSRCYLWDGAYQPLDQTLPLVKQHSTPLVGAEPQSPVQSSFAVGSLVGTGDDLVRYIGGITEAGLDPTPYWPGTSFAAADADATCQYAYSDDVAVRSVNQDGTITTQLITFDPDQPAQQAWSSPVTLSPGGANPSIGGDYLTAGDALYLRQPGNGWQQVPVDLPGDVDPASIQNCGTYLVYQDNAGSATQSYAVLLGNGGATVLGAIDGGPQKVSAGDPTHPGTQLAGASVFVTYPAADAFDAASSLTLHRVVDGDVSGPLTNYPVSYVAVDNGFGEQRLQGYLYDTTSVTYSEDTGVAQYTKVTAVPGVADPGSNPDRPFGWTEHYFSNGAPQQTGQFYPPGTEYNYAGLLNGVQLCEMSFDSSGTPVASTVNYWQAYESDPDDPTAALPGAYLRRTRTETSQDGMEPHTSQHRYDPATGLQTTVTTSVYGSTGTERTMVTTTTYGYQVPAYADALLAAHQLTAVVQRTTTVDGTTTTSNVTTLCDWATSGTGRWAAKDSYKWLGTGDGPTFDFTGEVPADWLLTRRIVTRSPSGYQPTELLDARGVPTSFLFDATGSYPVARIVNASLSGGELAWADFESYGQATVWQVGAATVDTTDAHTGVASLLLAPATTPGLSASLNPARQSFDYVVCAWVKTSAGFAGDPGAASWTVNLTRSGKPVQSPTTVAVSDTGGVWAPMSVPVALTAAADDGNDPVTVEISLTNGKTTASLSVDDVRFAPVACNFGVRVYDAASHRVTATIGCNANTTRVGYDGFLRRNLVAGPIDNVTSITTVGYSRDGNADTFNAIDPNLELGIMPRSGGSYDAFATGDEWRTRWQPSSTAWQVSNGRLTYSGTVAGTLQAIAAADVSDYAVLVRLRPTAVLSQPLSIQVGTGPQVSWSPANGGWQLAEGGKVVQSREASLWQTPLAPYQEALDNGTAPGALLETFASYGCAIGQPQVTVVTAGQSWAITDQSTSLTYYLYAGDDQIAVCRPAVEWLLIVGADRLLCYADGHRQFSYLPTAALSGPPTLRVGDPVAVESLVFATNPHLVTAFQDGVGNHRQTHQLLGGLSLARQIVYDQLGRPAVRTKTASVEPADATPLMTYRPDFVTGLDWTSGAMTGLVADAYPADDGYPYQREIYEDTPNGRVIERGLPGASLGIDLTNENRHTTRYAYTTNDDSYGGLPAARYHVRITTDADGTLTSDLADRLGRPIITQTVPPKNVEAQQVFVGYDTYGNATECRLPNYFSPPQESSADDWLITTSYDFFGRLATRTAPASGTTNCIYSPTGDLRFIQESAAADDGIYLYHTYDVLGRVVEIGQISGVWDATHLQSVANTDPSWPPSPPTWRKRIAYDGDGSSPYEIGRPVRVEVNLGDDGTAEVVEELTYDAWGSLVQLDTTATGYDQAVHSIAASHDNRGALTAVTTLSDPTFAPVNYQYDELGRVVAVGTSDDATRFATYEYNADSTVATEVLNPGGASPVQRTINYSPPAWPTSIKHTFADSSLTVGVDYTSGGLDGAGYYTGQVAQLEIQRTWAGAPAGITTQLQYDSQTGALQSAQTQGQPDWSIGPVSYDMNGNPQSATIGGAVWSYEYHADDRLLGITGAPQGPMTFQYDSSGHVTTAAYPDRTLTFTVDHTLRRARTAAAAHSGGDTTTVQYTYSGQDTRLLKQVTTQDGSTSTLYLSGLSSYPVIERTRGSGSTETAVRNVQGMGGLIAIEPAGGEPVFVLTDHQRSTRAVVDDSGEVLAWFDYTPYGQIGQSGGEPPVPIRYLFTGQEFDPELAVCFYRSRFYDPVIGRFYSPDEKGQFASPYTYAGDDPVSGVDPSGGMGWLAILGYVAQAVFDVVMEVVSDGAATPVVAMDVDAALTEAATDTVATESSDVLDTGPGRITFSRESRISDTTFSGESRVSDPARLPRQGGSQTARTAFEVRPGDTASPPAAAPADVPSGYSYVGSHYTSSVFDRSFEDNGVLAEGVSGQNYQGKAQLGEGFYTTRDPMTGEAYGRQAVNRYGGELRRWDVYVKNFDQTQGGNVALRDQWKPLPWRGGPNDRYITGYDWLQDGSAGQLKLNPRVLDRVVINKRFITTTTRFDYFRMPARVNSGSLAWQV